MFWPVSDHVYISVEKRVVQRAHGIKDCTTKKLIIRINILHIYIYICNELGVIWSISHKILSIITQSCIII